MNLVAVVAVCLACFAVTCRAAKCAGGDACWPSAADMSRLEAALDGSVLQHNVLSPLSPAWNSAIHLHNPRVQTTPAVVVRANSTRDVVASVAFAYAKNLLFSVKSSGHCYSGNCLAQGSFHLDLSLMGAIDVDVDAMTMRVQPGTDFDRMYAAANASGVLVAGGMCATVKPTGAQPHRRPREGPGN